MSLHSCFKSNLAVASFSDVVSINVYNIDYSVTKQLSQLAVLKCKEISILLTQWIDTKLDQSAIPAQTLMFISG